MYMLYENRQTDGRTDKQRDKQKYIHKSRPTLSDLCITRVDVKNHTAKRKEMRRKKKKHATNKKNFVY